jgi:hypothetical protein
VKPQTTRRSISVSGQTYARLKAHCEGQGVSVSGFVEQLVEESVGSRFPKRPEMLRLEARVARLTVLLSASEPSHPGACSPMATDCDGDCATHGWWRKHIAEVEAVLAGSEAP